VKVEIFTVVKNGGLLCTLFYEHYQKKFPGCIFNIYDNYSKDNTREVFNKEDCIVRRFLKYTEPNLQKFKNTAWKGSKADWVLVCDIDELVEITSKDLEKEKGDAIKFKAYQMLRLKPESTLNELTYGYRSTGYDKTLMFRPTILDINFSMGSHAADPAIPKHKINVSDYKLLHFNLNALNINNFIDVPIENIRKDRKDELYPFSIGERGIWESKDVKTSHFFDRALAEELYKFFKSERVREIADFGCGLGDYVSYFNKNGLKADGYDGNPFTTEINPDCKVIDLSKPLKSDHIVAKYCWIISFEVGEHIPEKYEDTFIENLHRNNKKGIILTWALEGIPGYGHVNCRSPEYIKDKFIKLGYTLDQENTNQLRKVCELDWLSWSLMVLRKN